ncbi:hypothetical protein ABZ642_10220 [Streptomyces sp. NPDC007157]|uniref:hypothetical protein n=1 Tax=Streptomyces sp. NPDC007157 TaxID=3154681 RepID=UPI0033D49702
MTAHLDSIVVHLSRLLAAHRRRLNTPRGSRVLGTFRQADIADLRADSAAASRGSPPLSE